MINFLANIFGYLMDWCYKLLPNWVAAIALFTLITKIILIPVSLWSNANGLKMVSIMPEINRIKARFYGDRERIDEAQAAMYKETGYHPLLTMVPLAIQIIILLGLIGVIHNITDTGWAPGLGLVPVNDGGWSWIMPLAAGFAAVVLSLAQNRINPLQREQSRGEQLFTNGVSVGISLILGAFVSVGVALYWIFSNLMTILVQLVCNLIMPPKKYVDYEDLAESRAELQKLDSMGPVQTKELKKREKADYKRFFSIVNKKLVFTKEEGHARGSLLRFAVLAVCQATVSGFATKALVGATGAWAVPIKIIVDVLLFFISFQIQNRWVFRSEKKGA